MNMAMKKRELPQEGVAMVEEAKEEEEAAVAKAHQEEVSITKRLRVSRKQAVSDYYVQSDKHSLRTLTLVVVHDLIVVMRHALEFVSACSVNISFNVFVSRYLFERESMQVVQMLRVSHREDSGIESDVVPSMKVIDYVLVVGEDPLRQAEAQVSAMSTFLILRLHLYRDA